MRRILIVGSGGAGKSTLARRIGAWAGLPVIHLDALYWKPGWVETPKPQWTDRVATLVERSSWVMDGNYGGTFDLRLAACDTVIFLDMPRLLCLWRVVKRRLRFRRRTRPDMGARCPERLTWAFIGWIWSYPPQRRPAMLQKLNAVGDEKRVVVLRSAREVEHFLAGLPRDTA